MPEDNPVHEKKPIDLKPEQSEERVDRREVAKRLGKLLTYTAPALIALSTAKDASATY